MKSKKTICFLVMSVLAFSGCATKGYQTRVHSGKFVQAKSQQHSGKVTKETVYVPVPIPGQLRPMPNTSAELAEKKPLLTKEQAVADAKNQAKQYPDQHDFFNAIMTYNYMPGALYTIYTAPLNITDVVFETGEKIISQAAGDTLRWQIASTYSGEGKDLRWHILIKPQKAQLNNSMIITTNKRTYHVVLKSVEVDQAMISVNWNYPKSMLEGFQGADLGNLSATGTENNILPPPNQSSQEMNLNLSDMKFDYHWRMYKGSTPVWYPQQIFSSGHQTYVKFPQEVLSQNAAMPVPFIKSDDGGYGTANFNWRIKGDYMIIDTIIEQAYLKTGTKESGETIVEIALKDN